MNVELELLTHPKYRALRRVVGPEALEYLIRLWGHCQTNKRGEYWPNANQAYVEDVCDWPGEAGALYACFLECRWIEIGPDGKGIIIHDWNEQNSFTVANWNRNPHGRNGKVRIPTPDKTMDKPMDNPRVVHGEPLRVSEESEESDKSEDARAPRVPEIPTESEFLAAFMTDGIPQDYLLSQFSKLHEQRAWLNGRLQLVEWPRIVRRRWTEDRAKWLASKPTGGGVVVAETPWNLQKKIDAEEEAIRLHPANGMGTRPDPNPTENQRADLKQRRDRVRQWKEKMAGAT